MKRITFNSLSDFYSDIKDRCKNPMYDYYTHRDDRGFIGLSNAEVLNSKFTYQFGVEKLRNLPEFEIEKAEWKKYFNSFDGYDIDIDRMYDGLDFLIERKKQNKLPKTIDIYVNVSESCAIEYDAMLNKTYAAIKIVDHLETLGVRTALYACAYNEVLAYPRYHQFLEICVKDYADTVNLGAICTAISPWMYRYWIFLWWNGNHPAMEGGLSIPLPIPQSLKERNAIYIDNRQCHTQWEANHFIKNLKIENVA